MSEYESVMSAIYSRYSKTKLPNICGLNFKWELGVKIADVIVNNQPYILTLKNYEDMALMGYPVEINLNDPEVIKLWMEV